VASVTISEYTLALDWLPTTTDRRRRRRRLLYD
jgi:hypothetical protein